MHDQIPQVWRKERDASTASVQGLDGDLVTGEAHKRRWLACPLKNATYGGIGYDGPQSEWSMDCRDEGSRAGYSRGRRRRMRIAQTACCQAHSVMGLGAVAVGTMSKSQTVGETAIEV